MNLFRTTPLRFLNTFDFKNMLKVLLILMIIQLAFLFIGISYNLSILYCPILYLYICNKLNIPTRLVLHLIFTSFVLVSQLFFMEIIYASIGLIFTIGYCFSIYRVFEKQESEKLGDVEFSFISVISLISLVNFVVITILILSIYFDEEVWYNENVFSYGISILYIVFSVLNLQELKNKPIYTHQNTREVYEKLSIIPSRYLVTANNIVDYFNTNESYLVTSFTLDALATELNENKDVVSLVLNQYMDTNFYQIVARYRIERAKKLIKTEPTVNIDTIMEECGFNSKSSFNKYFKHYVGTTPSIYRNIDAMA